MSELNDLLLDQKRSSVLILNFKVNTVKSKAADQWNSADLSARMELLEGYWAAFQSRDVILQRSADALQDRTYFKADTYMTTMGAFIDAKAWLQTKVSSLPSNARPAVITTVSEPSTSTHLERLKLPHFDGRQQDWELFKERFTMLVIQDKSIAPIIKFERLLECVSGEAASRLNGIQVLGVNFDSAWDALCQRYDISLLRFQMQLHQLINLPLAAQESAQHINLLLNTTNQSKTVFTLLQRPVEHWDDILVYFIVSKLAPSTKMDWAKDIEKKGNPFFPTYANIKTFLEDRVRSLDLVHVEGSLYEVGEQTTTSSQLAKNVAPTSSANANKTNIAQAASVHVVTQPPTKKPTKVLRKCSLCSNNHSLAYCNTFSNFSLSQRWDFVKKEGLCFNCLDSGHTVSECSSQSRCLVCQQKHHTRLHQDQPAQLHHALSQVSPEETNVHTVMGKIYQKTVILSTACVILSNNAGQSMTVRALLDSGAETSFISEHVAQALSLRKTPAYIAISGVGGVTTAVAKYQVQLTLASADTPTFSFSFPALVLAKLTAVIPRSSVKREKWPHLDGLKLADPNFGNSGRIDCLLSSEVFAAALLPGLQKGTIGSPVALNSVWGYVIMGAVSQQGESNDVTACHAAVDHELSQELKRFWELEETPSDITLSPAEQDCMEHFLNTHRRTESGRYEVRLPFTSTPEVKNSQLIAGACLTRMEKRLAKDETFRSKYNEFMDEYEDLQHMEKVPSDQVNVEQCNFIPHHAVFKNDESRKIRVVFNASQKGSNGRSLNSFLHTGPKLQEDIPAIILRWRFPRFVFSCDVIKMFRQFLVYADDTWWQLILWRSDPSQPFQIYRLRTVTYGTACAPFLSNACMLQLAKDEELRFPLAAKILREGRYADDFFSGEDTIEQTLSLQDQLVQMLDSGGMEVGKWSANDERLLQNIKNVEPHAVNAIFEQKDIVTTLGLRWIPAEDAFCFKVSELPSIEKPTKRIILSAIAKLFDPMGWLSPIIVRAKLLLQNLWMLGVDWDAPIPANLQLDWLRFREQLVEIELIRIPRWLDTNAASTWQLHGFCDASERAYAAAVFAVCLNDDKRSTRLLMAKSKVAPIKVISIPKLELCGAALLAQLVRYLLTKLPSPPSRTVCWSDSKVTLAWLQGHPSRWQTFVANRVSFIISALPSAEWKHVPTKDNPADLASRGCSPDQLCHSDLWWYGPSWLSQDDKCWPVCSETTQTTLESKFRHDCQMFATQVEENSVFDWNRYSSLDKMVRILAYTQRWRCNAKLPASQRQLTWLTASELATGKTILLRIVQRNVFAQEYHDLVIKGHVSHTSSFYRTLPYLHADGLIRVGGRLQHSLLTEDEKHPILLPANHHVSALIIRQAHRVTLHGGALLVQGLLARHYWIVRGRNFIRSVIRKCITCARYNANTLEQQMGNLPAVRSRPARAFTYTGVDYAGPFWIRASGGRGQKAFKGYVAIFICMVTKAVHLEIVSDYTTAAFIAAYTRFISKRGPCKIMYSDHGTTFQGAEAEIGRLFDATAAMSQEIAAAIAEDGVTWSYIPPRAPNFDGLWEANVKSFKRHLYRAVGEKKLTYEEFTTVAAQIEACLNSRPLNALRCDLTDYAVLTPGHFLIGAPLISLPKPFEEDSEKMSPGSRWHLLTLMRNFFWKRWHKEYLTQLQQRSRWLTPNQQLQVGDLVLFKDQLTPPSKWPLARVVKLHPGSDNLNRVATIRTAQSEYTRPINKLILLPVSKISSEDYPEST